MLELLERQQTLTGNQRRIICAAILGDMLEFFDYFLIGFVLAFIVGPWQLTYGESAIILLSSGVGSMIGAGIWGWAADRIGRRKVFIATVLNFAIASGILALTPDRGWEFLAIFRFFVGFGVGGLYCVDLPLVQEFVPSSKRGRIGGIITAAIPLGVGLGSVLGAFLAPIVGWRGLFVVGLFPAALTMLIRVWVPESPRWLIRMGPAGGGAKIACLGAGDEARADRTAYRARWDPASGLDRAVQVSSQPLRVLSWQSRRANWNLRIDAVGADTVHASPHHLARPGLLFDDLCQSGRLHRAHRFLVSVGCDRPSRVGRLARVRRRRDDSAHRIYA
jgi:MFS family permease